MKWNSEFHVEAPLKLLSLALAISTHTMESQHSLYLRGSLRMEFGGREKHLLQ